MWDFSTPVSTKGVAHSTVADGSHPGQSAGKNAHIPAPHLVGAIKKHLQCRILAKEPEQLQEVGELLECRVRFGQPQEVDADKDRNGLSIVKRGNQTIDVFVGRRAGDCRSQRRVCFTIKALPAAAARPATTA